MLWSLGPLSWSTRGHSFEDLAHSQGDFHQTFGHDDDDDNDDDDDDVDDDDVDVDDVDVDDDDDDDDDDDVNLAMIHSMISSS